MDGNKTIRGIVFAAFIALAITACKVQPPGYVGLYVDNLTSVNDTIYPGELPLNMLDTALTYVFNPTSFMEAKLPVYLLPAEEIFKISSDSVYQPEVEKLLKAITDSVQLLDYQMNELQKQLVVVPDTSFTGEKQQLFLPRDSLQTDILSQQMLRNTNDKIQKLQKQLNSLQNTAVRTPRQTTITRDPARVQPLSNRLSDQLTLQIFQAQSDTIQFLKSQIQKLQLELQKTDTVYVEKEAKELQPAKELDTEQKATDLLALQNAIQLLKTRVLNLEAQTVPEKTTPVIAMQEEKDVPVKEKSDTTLIVAFYKLGEIKPIEEESVLKQIKELNSNKNVTKLTLSGFTDNSGNATINKKITTRRLNYLSEKMLPWISKEKIFFQNFGDTFASDTMVNDERRIEIRIHTK
jgi:outer membrane protein OmpA-like peptidoglycan-associated protein